MLSFHRNLSVFAQNIWLLHKVYENWSQMYFHKIYRCEFRDFEDFFLWKKYLWRKYVCITLLKAKAYSGPCETSMMEIFSETIDYIIIFEETCYVHIAGYFRIIMSFLKSNIYWEISITRKQHSKKHTGKFGGVMYSKWSNTLKQFVGCL